MAFCWLQIHPSEQMCASLGCSSGPGHLLSGLSYQLSVSSLFLLQPTSAQPQTSCSPKERPCNVIHVIYKLQVIV
jgi:hypothetical protein